MFDRVQDGMTALMSACDSGQLNTIRLLVSRGANVNARTRVSFACLRRSSLCTHELASSSWSTQTGITPLHWAARGVHKMHPSVVSFLVEQPGIDFNAKHTVRGVLNPALQRTTRYLHYITLKQPSAITACSLMVAA